MSEQDTFSEQDRLQESVLEIKYKQVFERPINRQVYWETNYAVMLVVLGFVFLYRSLSIQDLLLCRSSQEPGTAV